MHDLHLSKCYWTFTNTVIYIQGYSYIHTGISVYPYIQGYPYIMHTGISVYTYIQAYPYVHTYRDIRIYIHTGISVYNTYRDIRIYIHTGISVYNKTSHNDHDYAKYYIIICINKHFTCLKSLYPELQ